ncbi:hypothetical protein [Brevibacillus formosus]|uniref:hypothetical protein n=1 Tax=Brevibacillus formosus TaxID=54913 RepID=UPI001F1F9345|nr:hypothetical protein [Brevibacillus formosus]
MNIGMRVLAAVISPFFTGLYAALIIYIYRDPNAPYGFGQEYLLGVLISMAMNLIVFVWLSVFVDWLVSRSHSVLPGKRVQTAMVNQMFKMLE